MASAKFTFSSQEDATGLSKTPRGHNFGPGGRKLKNKMLGPQREDRSPSLFCCFTTQRFGPCVDWNGQFSVSKTISGLIRWRRQCCLWIRSRLSDYNHVWHLTGERRERERRDKKTGKRKCPFLIKNIDLRSCWPNKFALSVILAVKW